VKSKLFAVAVSVLVGCGSAGEDVAVGTSDHPVVGGQINAGDPGVVGVFFASPGATQGRICTGMMIGRRTVLTAGHCVWDAIEGDYVDNGYVWFGYDANAADVVQIDVVEARAHRLFNGSGLAKFDLAVLLLASDAPVSAAPVILNERSLTGLVVPTQDKVRSIGYGVSNATAGTGAGVKRSSQLPLNSFTSQNIIIGDDEEYTCQGDSGGPAIFVVDGVEKVIGIHSWSSEPCITRGLAIRIDAFVDDFIYPAVDAWEGDCKSDGACDEAVTCPRSPDPDCDPCGPDGTCATDCATPDWDCPPGLTFGKACVDEFDCDSRLCIEAIDDPRIKYCSVPCDPAEEQLYCDAGQTCENVNGADVCAYIAPTPTAQGADCASGADCRSTLCDPVLLTCVEACDPANDTCTDGNVCSPSSLAPHVCRPPQADGGFCAAGQPGAASPRSLGFMALVLLASLGLVVLRRRS
jgi:hypothetical protein